MDVIGRTRIQSLGITALALNIFAASAYGQATPGENFNAQLEEACFNTQIPGRTGICNEFRTDGGADGPNGGVGGQNNFDTLGAQNQTIAADKERATMFQAPTWSVFGAVNIGNRQRSTTRLENGYDGDVIGGSFGIDKALSEKFVAGLVLGQYRFDGGPVHRTP